MPEEAKQYFGSMAGTISKTILTKGLENLFFKHDSESMTVAEMKALFGRIIKSFTLR